MDDQYERQARQLQDEIKQLEKERESCRDAVRRAETTLGGTPRRRDRNKFFSLLLHGDLAELERIRPVWKELRRFSREVRRVERKVTVKKAKLGAVVQRAAESSFRYRALLAESDKEKAVKRSVEQLLDAVRAAQKKIHQASGRRPQNAESGSTTEQDVKEVAERIRAVRKHVVDVTKKAPPHHSFHSSDAMQLDTDFPVADDKARSRRYKETKGLLDSLERNITLLLRDVKARENSLAEQRRRCVQEERARFRKSIE